MRKLGIERRRRHHEQRADVFGHSRREPTDSGQHVREIALAGNSCTDTRGEIRQGGVQRPRLVDDHRRDPVTGGCDEERAEGVHESDGDGSSV